MSTNLAQQEFILGIVRSEFFKILIDRGLLAVVALLFGFGLARALERYKREQAVLQGLSSLRVKALTDIMSLAAQIDMTVNLLMQLDPDRDKERSSKLIAKAKEQMNLLGDAANQQSFFLGRYLALIYWFGRLQGLRVNQWAEDPLDERSAAERDIRKLEKQMQRIFRNGPDRSLSWSAQLVILKRRLAD